MTIILILNPQYGEVTANDERYSVMRYCIEKSDDVHDGWKLMTCYQDYYLQKGFHIFSKKQLILCQLKLNNLFSCLALFISISLLIFTVFVYAHFKELRDFQGKSVIGLAVSQIFAYMAIPLFRYFSSAKITNNSLLILLMSTLIISLVLILLWITVMIVHMFFTFR
jgi:hypothetical protein